MFYVYREKWTLYDESTRVPLLIHHPQSPFKGMHYTKPVEHIDIFPTVHDLIGAPFNRVKKFVHRPGGVAIPLSGQSLAPVVLGVGGHQSITSMRRGKQQTGREGKMVNINVNAEDGDTGGGVATAAGGLTMPTLNKTIAISQLLRCVALDQLVLPSQAGFTYAHSQSDGDTYGYLDRVMPRVNMVLGECDMSNLNKTMTQAVFMGYSMRTSRFRYTAWVLADRATFIPLWGLVKEKGPYTEELYDHRNEKLSDFTHLETVNLAPVAQYRDTLLRLRNTLFTYLRTEVIYSPI
jgi:hypothetical protein